MELDAQVMDGDAWIAVHGSKVDAWPHDPMPAGRRAPRVVLV